MIAATTMIAARGIVTFRTAWDADFETTGRIDGPAEWSRPVVGLVYDSNIADADPRSLPYSPVVVSEWGLLYRVDDYIHMCAYCAADCAAMYHPEIDGPIGDSPRRRIPIPVAVES